MASPEEQRPAVPSHGGSHLQPGRLLAQRYLLQERLGDGGHAEVWAALDVQQERRVALKFLHLRSCSPEQALPVLRHEAQMAQRLDHPGVLRVADPQRDGALVFLPMDYAAGGDAATLRGAPWQQLLPVLLEVARVLEHAHSRGVVHRDIKPGNVLFDELGALRVSDFGTSARTGSCEAMAAGSPFSASPQQLRDEPATTADDVYGLGALAYELLTRYPPFYPQFDAQRVQVQEPAPPVPVHAAPPVLLALVQRMLARDTQARPDLGEVMRIFESCLAEARLSPDPGVAIEPLPPAVPVKPRAARRSALGYWVLGATSIAGITTLLWLPPPRPGAVAMQTPAGEPIRSVADAVIDGAPAPAIAAPAADDQAQQLAAQLRTGNQALAAYQPALARASFQQALAVHSDSTEAQAGLAATARLESLLEGFAAGMKLEMQGELTAAQARYQTVLAQRADFTPAAAALARVRERVQQQRVEDLLATGADALREGRVAAAQSAYGQAADAAPQDPRVVEGQRRVAEVLENERNTADLATGVALEAAERWDEAVAHYRGASARSETLQFAQDGLLRSERRAQLDHELDDYLARPERLTAAAVRRAAEQAAARGEASSSGSPRLQQQLQRLRAALQALTVQVPVAIISDDSTQVHIAPAGDLGSFLWRELQLAPGQYTVTGTRDGFRDVRYELTIAPGQQGAQLSVRCTEPI
ncbi:MAG: protein kinase [Steroidobacteraceae bacterium]